MRADTRAAVLRSSIQCGAGAQQRDETFEQFFATLGGDLSDAPPGVADSLALPPQPADGHMPGAQPPPMFHNDPGAPGASSFAPPDGSHYAQQYAHAAPPEHAATLFVGHLPNELAPGTLERLFEQCGVVTECAVIRDKETGRGKGFAFVTMGSDEEAQAAVHTLDGFMLQGRRMRVAPKVCLHGASSAAPLLAALMCCTAAASLQLLCFCRRCGACASNAAATWLLRHEQAKISSSQQG